MSPQIAHPRWKAKTSIGYSVGPLNAALHWRFIDKMVHQDRVANPAATTRGVRAYHYFDLDASFRVSDGVQVSAGLNNITDEGPPFVSGQPLTTDSATYDIIGRTYFVGVKAKF